MEEQEKKTITGIILDKKEKEKGPKGDFIIDDQRYTCWSETLWEKFDIDDEVIVTYVVKKNEYNGKTFYNRNISNIKLKDEGEVVFTQEEKDELEDQGINTSELKGEPTILKSVNGKIRICGITYKIKDIELELVK